MKVLITGVAGFIGMHTTLYFLKKGFKVFGIDNINNYYDTELKKDRLNEIQNSKFSKNFNFKKLDLAEKKAILGLFKNNDFDGVIHLAAQAGVRYSIENPDSYINSNILGFFNILEACKNFAPKCHLVYASSSSVYGLNENLPFTEEHSTDHSLSLYAASKKSNEVMAHSYSNMYNLRVTGLRFFTVYGPWGRPDMALFLFTEAIIKKNSIKLFNNGNMVRDFTYIDDIVKGIFEVFNKPAKASIKFDPKNPSLASSSSNYKIFNIGNGNPIPLSEYVKAIEDELGLTAKKVRLPIQKGDVVATASNTDLLFNWTNFRPKTTVKTGVKKFINWYCKYYSIKKIKASI